MRRYIMNDAKFYYKDNNAPKPNQPNHIGTSIIIKYDDKILLEARCDSDRWAIIGGGLRVDESLISCVIRETFEETGISLSENQIKLYKFYDDPSRIASYPDGNILRVITVVFETELAYYPNLICSTESRKLQFFSKKEIENVEIAETHIPIIQDVLLNIR